MTSRSSALGASRNLFLCFITKNTSAQTYTKYLMTLDISKLGFGVLSHFLTTLAWVVVNLEVTIGPILIDTHLRLISPVMAILIRPMNIWWSLERDLRVSSEIKFSRASREGFVRTSKSAKGSVNFTFDILSKVSRVRPRACSMARVEKKYC